ERSPHGAHPAVHLAGGGEVGGDDAAEEAALEHEPQRRAPAGAVLGQLALGPLPALAAGPRRERAEQRLRAVADLVRRRAQGRALRLRLLRRGLRLLGLRLCGLRVRRLLLRGVLLRGVLGDVLRGHLALAGAQALLRAVVLGIRALRGLVRRQAITSPGSDGG